MFPSAVDEVAGAVRARHGEQREVIAPSRP
jgi:hypothetical protein